MCMKEFNAKKYFLINLQHFELSQFSSNAHIDYTSNRYIVPMEFRVHFFPRISAFSRHTKMHLNGMFLIGNEFFKIIVPL